MAAATETPAKRQRRSETTTYLVQIRKKGEDGAKFWRDVDEITVPAGTRRRSVVAKVLSDIALPLQEGDDADLRVIPTEHAEAVPVAYERPPAQLRVQTL